MVRTRKSPPEQGERAAAAPPSDQHAERMLSVRERRLASNEEETRIWDRRFAFSVGIANAAALAGLASRIAEKPLQATWLLPSAWLLLIGLVTAGLVPWLRLRASIHYRRLLTGARTHREAEMPEFNRAKTLEDAHRLARAAIWTSAVCFVLAIALPLVALTIRALSG